jgi:hypothetical protein
MNGNDVFFFIMVAVYALLMIFLVFVTDQGPRTR